MPLQRVHRRSASAAVFDQLVDEVLAGGLEPGEALPAERSLTGVLAVNRQAIREALQRLAQAGLVEITHGGPTKILDYRRTAGLDLLPRLLIRGESFDPEVVRSIMEMRASIGPDVARLAAVRASAEIVDRVEQVVREMSTAGEPETQARLDVAFWDLLVDGSDNIAYRLAYNSLRSAYEPVLELVYPVFARELEDLDSRDAIAGALRSGDGPSAEQAARTLLEKGSTAMTGVIAALVEGD
ncbi:MAG: FadR/GntR family transcriptional regulator [Actinomycetota bacterium]